MCGISGIIGEEPISRTLLTSIRNLEYRGYDSCGLALIHENSIEVRKNTGTVDEVNSKEQLTDIKGFIGIAHTRWATHGGVTQANSHPHLSSNNTFAIVHNGIFSNYHEIKAELESEGVTFRSLTDSEAFAHLVEKYYREDQQVEKAFIRALKAVEGAFAIAMVSVYEPQRIFCAKKDSPLILGLGQQFNFVSSDINGFLEHTRNAVVLDDGEYAILSKTDYTVKQLENQSLVKKEVLYIEWDAETTKKGGYSHYMLKEIFDQPSTIQQALKIDHAHIQKLADMVQSAQNGYLLGVGTTYYVGLMGQYYFSHLAKRYLPTISSDEFHEVAVVSPNDIVLAMTQSGETYDTKMAINFSKQGGAQTAAIVNVMGSSISMMVDHVIMQGSGPEICVVSTKAALSQMVILLRAALETALQQKTIEEANYSEHYEALEQFSEIIQNTLNEQSGFIRNIAREHRNIHNWLFLGCGFYYPIAMESALKMKEVTYLHAEAMPAGFLKHGTLAMVDESLYSLFFVPLPEQTQLHQKTLVAIEEVKTRGGRVIGFAFEGDQKAAQLLDHYITLPKVHPCLAPLLQMIMAQLLSYYTALELGCNIDKPRNLAKSVTVA